MAELRLASKTNGLEENVQVMEAGTGILGRVQGCSLVLGEWDQKGQGASGAELDTGCKE